MTSRRHAYGRFPTRRTWERRLAALPLHLPGLLSGFGRHMVNPRATARVKNARPNKDRCQGKVIP
jgi:hypothetical protein